MEYLMAIFLATVLTINTNGDIETFAALTGLYLVFYQMGLKIMPYFLKLGHRILK